MGRLVVKQWMTVDGVVDDADDPTGLAAPLRRVPKHVFSRSLEHADEWVNTSLERGDAAESVARMKAGTDGLLHVDGSARLATSLLAAGLVDELWLLIHPYVMGTGPRFPAEGAPAVRLEVISLETLPLGVVAARYRVAAP